MLCASDRGAPQADSVDCAFLHEHFWADAACHPSFTAERQSRRTIAIARHGYMMVHFEPRLPRTSSSSASSRRDEKLLDRPG